MTLTMFVLLIDKGPYYDWVGAEWYDVNMISNDMEVYMELYITMCVFANAACICVRCDLVTCK